MVEVAALLRTDRIHCKQRNRRHYKRETDSYFIFSFPFPQKPFSNRTTQARKFFSELSTFTQFFIPFLFFSSSTRVKLSKTKRNQKQKIFKLLQCCTKMNILLNSKVEPNYLLSTNSGKLIDLMIPFYLTT